MSGVITNQQAVQWCIEARKILKRKTKDVLKTGSRYEVDLKSLTDKVIKLAGELNKYQLATAKTELESKLTTVGQKIHDITGDTKLNDSQKHDQVKLQAEALETLAATAEEVTKKYDEYSKLRSSAEDHRRSLQSQGADETKQAPNPPGGFLHDNYKKIVDTLQSTVVDKGKSLTVLKSDLTDHCTKLEKKKIDTFAKDEGKNLKTLTANALSDAEHKPVYEDKVRRIQEAIAELALLPGASKQVENLGKLLKEGEKAAKPGNYKEAYAKLQGLSGNLKDGKKAAEEFQKSPANQTFEQELKLAKAAIRKYDELCGIDDPDTVKEMEKKVSEILKALAKDTSAKQLEESVKNAKQICTDLDGPTKEAQKLKEECEKYDLAKLVADVESKVDAKLDVDGTLGSVMVATITSDYREAQSLLGLQNYSDAKTKFEKVKVDAEKVLNAIKPLEKDWATQQQKVTEELKSYQEIAQKCRDVFPDLSKKRGEIASAWETDILVPMSKPASRNYEQGTKNAKEYLETIRKDLAPLKETYEQLATAWEKSNTDRREAFQKAESAIKALQEKGADTSGFQERLKTALEKLSDEQKKAFTDPNITDRPAHLQTSTKSFTEEATKIESEAKTLSLLDPTQDNELKKLVAQAEEKQKEAEFKQAQIDVETWFTYLKEESYDSKKYGELKKELAKLTDRQAIVDFVNKKLKPAKDEVDKVRETAAKDAKTLVDDCNKALKELIKAHKSHRPYLDTLSEHIKSLEQALKSGATTAMEVAKKNLGDFKNSLTGEIKTALQDVDKKLVLVEDAQHLKDPNVKKFQSARLALLEKRLKKSVKPTTYGQDPRESLKPDSELSTFEKDVTQIVEQAKAFQTVQVRVDKLADELEKELKDPVLKAILDANPKTLKSIKARITSARTPQRNIYAGELSLQTVEVLLKQFKEEAEGTGKDAKPGKLLLNYEAQQGKEEVDAEILEKKFIADLSVFEKNELREATAAQKRVGKSHDEARWKDLQKAYSQAKKLASKKQLDRANDSLRRAKEMARDFAYNPLGPTFTARGQLLNVEKRWKVVVARFAKSIRKLAVDIQAAAKDDTSVDQKQITFTINSLNEISRYFDPSAFSKEVEEMSKEGVDTKTLRRHKETGLRKVRSYQSRVNSDPLLSELAIKNPFEPVTVERVKDVLTDLELNLKRA